MQNSFGSNIIKGIGSVREKYFVNKFKDYNVSWLKLKYLKHLPPGKIVKMPLFGKTVYFSNHIEYLALIDEIFIEQYYSQPFRDNALIIDCGANIGMSVLYYKRICPSSKVIAFEPDDKNCELLQKNMESFGLYDVTVHKQAVWIKNDYISFDNAGSLSSRITDEAETKNMVSACRLKDVIDTYDVIDFLKMDIEGAEYAVLKDAGSSIQKIKNMFVEYHGSFSQNNELTEIFNLLSANGFNYYIKEVFPIYEQPFNRKKNNHTMYDLQLNIFCFNNELNNNQ